MVVDISQDTAGCRVLLEVFEHSIDLVVVAVLVVMLNAHLIAVRLADRTGLICQFETGRGKE